MAGELKLHDGSVGPSSLAPVVSAPDTIGAVKSYAADIAASGPSPDFRAARTRSRAMQIAWTLLAALVLGFGSSDFVGAPVAVGIVAGVLTFALLEPFHPKPKTTFVGSKGIAVVEHGANPKITALDFANVDHLLVERTLFGEGGVRLRFVYAFRNDRDGVLLRIVGGVNLARDGTARATSENAYWFASAAERAWIEYRLPQLLAGHARGEPVTFRSARRETVTIHGDEVELFPAEGGRVRTKLLKLRGPEVNGEMIHFGVTLNPPPAKAGAFQPPGEGRTCVFRGNELRDLGLLEAMLEALRPSADGRLRAT